MNMQTLPITIDKITFRRVFFTEGHLKKREGGEFSFFHFSPSFFFFFSIIKGEEDKINMETISTAG